jgi:DnaJ-class molecular chaperone
MKRKGEITTESCPQCQGKKTVSRKSKSGEEIESGCPVCDGYGFVISNEPLKLKNPLK